MILVTGGTGYIGSHTVVQLLDRGRQVVILDNLANSSDTVLDPIRKITGASPVFINGDIRNRQVLRDVFSAHDISAVIHFAGLKAVGESGSAPLRYYDTNVSGSIALFEEMERAGVFTLIFSSSATVYGDPGYARFTEQTPLSPVNVYGRTKQIIEEILRDAKKAQPLWRIALLRYFNPVGAHESGLIGENPSGIPNNLMPFIAQVAVGRQKELSVFGDDYPTPDGTGLRDYIHVEDLAAAHLAALDRLEQEPGVLITLNVGTGRPYSVLEMIRAFEKASGRRVPYKIVARRPGDIAACYADPSLAAELLGWKAQHGIERMCADAWNFMQQLSKSGAGS